jgi:hypothetical protein
LGIASVRDFTLDEATALIGRLAEIDRQLTGFDAPPRNA